MTDKRYFEKDINVPSKKQIIIDGVDVSGCDYYYCNNDGKHLCFKDDSLATCGATCSYGAIYLKEQLARKTQECAELKNELNEYKKAGGALDEGEAWYGLAQKYEQTLEEIEKEIRDFQCDNCEDYHCETCDMKDILDIINKAKGGVYE